MITLVQLKSFFIASKRRSDRKNNDASRYLKLK